MALAGRKGGASAPPSHYSAPVRQGAESSTLEGNGELRLALVPLLPPATSPLVAPTAESGRCGRTCSRLRDGADSFTELGQGSTEPPQKPFVGDAAPAPATNTTLAAAIANFPATEHHFMLLFT